MSKKLLFATVLIVVLGLGAGCSMFRKGAGRVTDGKMHLGRGFGVIVNTETFVGLGFDEAHTDLEFAGEADFVGTNGAADAAVIRNP